MFSVRGFEVLFPQAGALGLRGLFHSPFDPPGLSARECGICQPLLAPPAAHSRPLWVSPMNSPMRLGVSSAAAPTPWVFSISSLRLYFPALDHGLCCLSCSLVVPLGLSAHERGTAQSGSHHLIWSTSHRLATSPFHSAAHLCPSYRSG